MQDGEGRARTLGSPARVCVPDAVTSSDISYVRDVVCKVSPGKDACHCQNIRHVPSFRALFR